MGFKRTASRIAIGAVVACGFTAAALTAGINYQNKYTDKHVDDYNYITQNKCYLESKWLEQVVEVYRSDKYHSYHVHSNLPLDKYNADLGVKITKRLIAEDGQKYSLQVPVDAKYTTMVKNEKFTYYCGINKQFKSYFGFFDRIKMKT